MADLQEGTLPTHLTLRRRRYYAEAVQGKWGWYVFWQDLYGPGYGSRGYGMTEDDALALATRIREGLERP